ncbi:segmentation protein even-skipped-like [Pollicipes pollicipes]|uniref:segmentation protein even-skipped-like n=1 Tax=Pollicipes pollicipes TaxID=41117 RepID=UPI0018853CBF|nr:segmentation protein even-skipped-like [Pollicipes pollicipes]
MAQQPGAPEPAPFRPFLPADTAYPLQLLKAYSDLRERAPAEERPDSATAAEVARPGERLPPRVNADSSGSPPKPSDRTEDAKPTSCDSTEQLTERCSPPPAAKLAGDGALSAAQDPGIRRYRTAFRPDQIKRLEAEFLKDNYVSRPKRNELATELGLAEGTIKVWFQNRRMKHKRQQMTAWPLDPRFTDPALAAMILQAAVASGTYPYGGVAGLAAPPLPYYSPLAGSAKCRFSPYAPLPSSFFRPFKADSPVSEHRAGC